MEDATSITDCGKEVRKFTWIELTAVKFSRAYLFRRHQIFRTPRFFVSTLMSLPLPSIQLHAVSADSLKSLSDYDGTIVVFTDKSALKSVMPSAASFIEKDQEFGSEVQVLVESEVPGGRVILAPTGSLDGDFDDSRRFTGKRVIVVVEPML